MTSIYQSPTAGNIWGALIRTFFVCCGLLVSFISQAQYISRPEIVGYTGASFTFCQGFQLQLKFDAELMQGGNVFTVQMSDSNGNFINPVAVGTMAATNGQNQFINLTIPANTAPGPRIVTQTRGYRFRIISSRPAGTISQLNEYPFKVIRTNPVINPQPGRYGQNQWVGHVYTWQLVNPTINGFVNPTIQDFWNPTNYKGYFTKDSLSFELNWDRGPFPTGNNQVLDSNMVSCEYREYFAVRFRRRHTFPLGYYSLQFGADDGIRFSTDGGATWYFDSFREQQYNPSAPNNGCGVVLDGTKDLVVEYFQRFVQSRVLVNIVRTGDPNVVPAFDAGQNNRSVCASAAPFRLTATPANGTFIGPGVSANGLFNPRTAGAGTRKIYYQTGLAGCRKRDSITITVNPASDARFSGLDTAYCISTAPITLQTLSSGTFSGPGMAGNVWSAAVAGPGLHTIQHIVATVANCPDTVRRTVRVYAAVPTPSFILPKTTYCANEGTVNATISPAGGVFAGAGLDANGVFNPQGLNGAVRLVYRVRNGLCRDSVVLNVTVNPAPVASFTGLDTVYCQGAAPVALTGAGAGTFIGPGIQGSVFNPQLLAPGVYQVRYGIGGPCPDTASQTVRIRPLPGPITTSLPSSICPNGAPVVLTAQPAGGVFSGPGVGNGVFNPVGLSGNVTVKYKVTVGGCTDSLETTISITSSPSIIMRTDSIVCRQGGVVNLVADPPGGVWTGTGVTGSTFDPVVAGYGRVNLTYTINNAGCTGIGILALRVAGMEASASNAVSVCYDQPIGLQVNVTGPGAYTIVVSDQAGSTLASGTPTTDFSGLKLERTANVIVRVSEAGTNCSYTSAVVAGPAPDPTAAGYTQVFMGIRPGFTLQYPEGNALPARVLLTNTSQRLVQGGSAVEPIPAGSTVIYVINWGDGTLQQVSNLVTAEHTYAESAADLQSLQVRLSAAESGGPGCSYATELPVEVSSSLYPNVITPNGDGVNDALIFNGLAGRAQIQIFNRYGVLVQEEAVLTNTWKADAVAAGTYFYRVSGAGRNIKGWIEVVK